MAIWEEFEIQCTDYLRFGAYARFIHQGGADSTVPDILVETKEESLFTLMLSILRHNADNCLLPDLETCTFEYVDKMLTESTDMLK